VSKISFEDETALTCPLCAGQNTNLYHTDKVRSYHQCRTCSLVFVPQRFQLTDQQERREYDHHENSLTDEGYLKFLSRFSTPFLERLGSSKKGLDFGCGPAPALAMLLERAGHSVALYDPMFMDDTAVLESTYDFISSTEVVEHFRRPGKEFDFLLSILNKGGLLGVMTKMVQDQAAFTSWHYIRDPTHVSFYSRETFIYLGKSHGVEVSFMGNDVVFLKKDM